MGQKTSQAGLTYDNKNTSQESQGHISACVMEIFAASTHRDKPPALLMYLTIVGRT